MLKIEKAEPETLLKEIVKVLKEHSDKKFPILAWEIARLLLEKHYGKHSQKYLLADISSFGMRIAQLIRHRGRKFGIKSMYDYESPMFFRGSNPYWKVYYLENETLALGRK